MATLDVLGSQSPDHRRGVFGSQAVWALSSPVDVFAEWMDTQRATQPVLASLRKTDKALATRNENKR